MESMAVDLTDDSPRQTKGGRASRAAAREASRPPRRAASAGVAEVVALAEARGGLLGASPPPAPVSGQRRAASDGLAPPAKRARAAGGSRAGPSGTGRQMRAPRHEKKEDQVERLKRQITADKARRALEKKAEAKAREAHPDATAEELAEHVARKKSRLFCDHARKEEAMPAWEAPMFVFEDEGKVAEDAEIEAASEKGLVAARAAFDEFLADAAGIASEDRERAWSKVKKSVKEVVRVMKQDMVARKLDQQRRELERLQAEKDKAEAQKKARVAEFGEDGQSCAICLDSPPDAAFVSCGHRACFECASHLKKAKRPCHVCRKKITSVLKIFD